MRNLITFVISIVLLISLGCESDKTTNPVAPAEYQVILENLPDSLVWMVGEEMSIPVSALVLTAEGSLAPGVKVEFAVTSGEGSFDAHSLTSDQRGRVSAIASLTPAEGWQEFAALLIVPGGANGGKVAIRGVRQPARISFDAPNTTFKVGAGATVETTFKAIFSDSNGVGITGLPITVGLQKYDDSNLIFGTVSAEPMTNETGEVSIRFSSGGNFGKVNVLVETELPGMNEQFGSTLTLNVERLTNDVGSLTVRAFPIYMIIPADSSGLAVLRAQVRDAHNNGIAYVQVNYTTDLGSLSKITATDSSGVSTAEFRSNYEEGIAHITASIPGTNYDATTQIVVQITSESGGLLDLMSDKTQITVSNGLEVVNLTAHLQDGDGQRLANRPLVFTSTHGAVMSPIFTNALGIAYATFTDIGLPSLDRNGNVVPAKIYVKYDPLHLIDSCEVTILPRNPIASITLTTTKNQMGVASGDTAIIRATAMLANGAFATTDLPFHWEIRDDDSTFIEEWTDTLGHFGTSSFTFIPSQYAGRIRAGRIRLRAWIDNEDGSRIYSNYCTFTLLPGPPGRIRLNASPNELMTNDLGAYSTISTLITDTAGNPVEPGTLVRFRTTLGQITRSNITDDGGQTAVRLIPGATAGVAVITGTVFLAGGDSITGETTVTFVPGNPHSITLTADPEEISISETGGTETTTLTARVYDPTGNLVSRPTTVVFRTLNQPDPPQGCAFSNGTRTDSAITENGIGLMSLSAGFQVGGVLVKAYTWRDPDTVWANPEHTIPGVWRRDTISVINARVQVMNGPPAAIDIDYNTAGIDAGGGMWMIEVSARVYDSHLNPVRDEIAVGFTVIPDDVATITNGRTVNGMATVNLYYHSSTTYEPMTIAAEVQVANGQITAQRRAILPLQQGRLAFHADPQNWRFDRENPNDTCRIRTWVILTDGHGVLINNAPILFTTDRARFYWYNQVGGRYVAFYPEPARKHTGDIQHPNENIGVATVYLRGEMNDFFLDDETLETECSVRAQVEGTEVETEPIRINFTRR